MLYICIDWFNLSLGYANNVTCCAPEAALVQGVYPVEYDYELIIKDKGSIYFMMVQKSSMFMLAG